MPTYTYLGRTHKDLLVEEEAHIVLFEVMGEGPPRTILEDPEQRAPWLIHQTVETVIA